MLTIDAYMELTCSLVAGDAPDLSQRQMAVFLMVYRTKGPHTVRGMAAELNVSKPAITRALDRLGELELTKRITDAADKRSIHVQTTPKGTEYLAVILKLLAAPDDSEEVKKAA